MRRAPNLIPYAFLTRQARRKYRTQRDARTWFEFASEYRNVLVLLLATVFVAVVLYVRWRERQQRRQTPL